MAETPEFVEPVGDGWRLKVWVQPGAKKSELDGVRDGRLKIRLQAPAVENKANKALIAFVADLLGLKKSCVALESGEKSRAKTLAVRTEISPHWPRGPWD